MISDSFIVVIIDDDRLCYTMNLRMCHKINAVVNLYAQVNKDTMMNL